MLLLVKIKKYTYQVPVDALDQEIDCAAWSIRKEKWYDRTLVFRADSLPTGAFARSMVSSPEDLGLTDGTYEIAVTLNGGSGKASVASSAKLTVANGRIQATIVFSSANYDYMLVDGEKFLPVNTEGNSVFEIPVAVFDEPVTVIGDTVAMSKPHEIEYTLTFHSDTIKALD